jgi:hypothetical protein
MHGFPAEDENNTWITIRLNREKCINLFRFSEGFFLQAPAERAVFCLQMKSRKTGAAGFCPNCGQEHHLAAAPALPAALRLLHRLETKDRIDFPLPSSRQTTSCSAATEYLWGPARGKMFGVMVALAPDGTEVRLHAFSGQYNGMWQVPGWVDPVFDVAAFHRVHDAEEREIKALSRQINVLSPGSEQQQLLIRQRRKKSQQLMRAIHSLYRLRNFRGQEAGLEELFPPGTGIPTGTGDCCAPKLLQYAAQHGLQPLGLSEFYAGRENASGTRQHGRFYPSCRSKCYPILGFMLCGLGPGLFNSGKSRHNRTDGPYSYSF